MAEDGTPSGSHRRRHSKTGSNGGAGREEEEEVGRKSKKGDLEHNKLLLVVIVSGLGAALVAQYHWHKGVLSCLLWGMFGAYMPSYLDPSYLSYGRAWPVVAKLQLWQRLCKYFSASIVVLEALDPHKQYIFGAHPHGLGTWNHFLMMTDGAGFLSKVFPGERRDLAATVLFFIPLLRELLLWLGCVDAGSATANKVLKAGYSTLIYVGGEQEQILTTRGKHIIYVKKRKGFIRLALKYGVEVVPVYVWGENDLYTTLDHPKAKSFQLWLAEKCRIAFPPSWGRTLLPLVPKPVAMTVVLGRALNKDQPPMPRATREQVDVLHAAYVEELQHLFESTKATYASSKDAVLEIH